MSQFRPGGAVPGRHIGYSPWCSPSSRAGINCVLATKELHEHEPMAWDFLLAFARDNGLHLVDGDQIEGR